MLRHLTGEAHPPGHAHQPTNVVFALFPPLEGRHKKAEKRTLYAARGRAAFDAWAPRAPHPVAAAPARPASVSEGVDA